MDYTFLFIIGIVIVTMSLMLNYFKRQRLDAERQTKRRAVVEAAKEAERKRQLQANEPVKIKPEKPYSSASDRMPFTDSLGKSFSGGFTPHNVAKWELEIDNIGRQWAGTLDSKMIALQTLTQEANRVANRMELLLEQFERISQAHLKPKIIPIDKPPQPYIIEEITQEEPLIQQLTEPSTESLDTVRRFLPVGETEYGAKPLVLDDLEAEIDRLQQQIADETVEQIHHATILKIDDSVSIASSELTEPVDQQSSPTLSFSTANSTNPNRDHYAKPTYPLDSSSFSSATRRTTVSPSLALPPMGNMSFDSLYNDKSVKRSNESVFIPTDKTSAVNEPSISRLDLQKQVEMLNNYGYTPRQIAQSLNITLGEVDLMLKLRNEKN